MYCSLSADFVSPIDGQLMREGTDTPDPTKLFPRPRLKNPNVEAMAYAVTSCRYTCQSSTDDRDLGSAEFCSRLWRFRGEKLVKKPLHELVEENEGVQKRILHLDRHL